MRRHLCGQLERVNALGRPLVWMLSRPGSDLDDQETWETTTPAAWLFWPLWLLLLSVWLSSHEPVKIVKEEDIF